VLLRNQHLASSPLGVPRILAAWYNCQVWRTVTAENV